MSRPYRQASALSAAIAVPLLLATAGAASAAVVPAGPATARPTTGPSAAAPAVPRCPTSHLTAHLLPVSAGAGQRYQPVELTNTGPGECAVRGWGGFDLLDAHHHRLPTTVTRDDRAAGARRVILRPGHSVVTIVHFAAVGGTTPRDYTHPTYLQITPPDAVHHLTVPFTQQVYRGDLDNTPYTAADTGRAES